MATGFSNRVVSKSLGRAVAAACVAATKLLGEGEVVYQGFRPGPILDLDQLLASEAVSGDESGVILGRPGFSKRAPKPLRGEELKTAKNFYRAVTVEFLGLSILVEMRGQRRENSNVVDWRVHALRPTGYDPLGEEAPPPKPSQN